TWDLTTLYPDDESYVEDFVAAGRLSDELTAYEGRLGDSGKVLGDFMDLYWGLVAKLQRLRNYAALPVTVDQSDQTARQRAGEFQSLQGRFSRASAYISPELLALGRQRLAELASQDDRLAKLERYFDRLELQRPHVRSVEVEELLGGL